MRTNARPDGVTPRYWMWPYWMKESIYLVGRDAITSQGTLRWRVFNDTFRNSLSSYDDGTFTTHTRPYAFYGSVYNDYSYGGNADFEWNWNDQHTTRIASHFKRDVHREFQALPAIPVMHLDIPTYDVAIEHEWRVVVRLLADSVLLVHVAAGADGSCLQHQRQELFAGDD